MKKYFKKHLNKSAFTLIELIIVIAILAILAAIAIPAYAQYKEHAEKAANEANAKIVYDAAQVSNVSSDAGDDDGSEWATFVDDAHEPAGVSLSGAFSTNDLTVTVGSGDTQGTFPPA